MELKKLRNNASFELMQVSAMAANRREAARIKKESGKRVEDVVYIDAPQVELNGKAYGPMRLPCIFGIDSKALEIPVQAKYLEYCRAAMISMGMVECKEKAKHCAPDGSYFDKKRGKLGSFVAKRAKTKGESQFCVIPISHAPDADEVDVEAAWTAARDLVVKFVAGEDVSVVRERVCKRKAEGQDETVYEWHVIRE